MVRVYRVGRIAVWAFLLCSTSVFAASFTSSQSGNWNDNLTWGGAGVPGSGDDVTITANCAVTVSDTRVAHSVTLATATGNQLLIIDAGGSLLVEKATFPAINVSTPVPGSSNTVRINGGTLETSNSGIGIAGGTSVSKLEFTSLGGTATFAGDVAFSGTVANAQIDFGPAGGIVEIGGNLQSGGTILTNSTSLVLINGTGAQTINSYTFHHLTVNKAGTATLNGPITVNGDLAVTGGVLDDGGNQISLNGSGTSNVTVGSTGVLKLGAGAIATFFPTPLGTATMNTGSAVVYQSGLQQAINSDVIYDRLYLATLGGSVSHITTGGSLSVNTQLDITDNGLNAVTLALGTGTLDLGGDLTGDGTLSMTSGSMTIAGSFSSVASLSAGTGTVTYDGTGAQQVLGAPYHHLVINKSAGIATPSGNTTVNGNLTVSVGTLDTSTAALTLNGSGTVAGSLIINGALALDGGTVTVTGSLFIDVLASVTRTTGWVVGPLQMGMSATPARTFHVGTAAAYLPVDVDAFDGGTLTIAAVEGQSPDRTADNVLERYWTVSSGTVTSIDTITFNYNQTDVVTGDETIYILAHYDSGTFTFTHFGTVDDFTNTVSTTNVSTYIGDWVIGQPGSLAAASKLAITSINSGTDPQASTAFDVVVEAQDDDGDPTPVFDPTGIALSVAVGSGTLGGTTTGTIGGGADSTTISGVTYSPDENGVQLTATRTSGDLLDPGTSAAFNVLAPPSTLTVTSINDSGAGTLREAITTANGGGCTTPCTIDFSTSGAIILATSLPAITVSDLTIDGTTAPGAAVNTNAFGTPSNAVITLTLNGGGSIPFGFDIQETFVKIKGFAIIGFVNAGVRFTGDNSGSNVSGCYIGTDTTGTVAAANAGGVLFDSSTESSAGGMLPEARNVISGNTFWGITVTGTSNTISLSGNYIGTRADLAGALPNIDGIVVQSSASSVSIGDSGVGNVVSGNSASGVILGGSGATLVANLIGTQGSANTAIANSTGVYINAAGSNNTIGGASPSDVNVISGNLQNGILIDGDDNTVDNNLIGVAPDATTALGNGSSGIRLDNTASGNFLGTTFGNKIAFNTNDGVTIAGTGLGNAIRRGKIAANTNRGIDLGDDGTTANDATDADIGPNNLQNFPTISSAAYNAGNVDATLSLDSSGGVNVNFVVFDIWKADGSAPAQALEYLGNSGCLAGNVFASTLVSVPAGTTVVGNNIVAAATAYSDAACSTPSEGTSELSPATRVSGDIHWIAGTGNWETAANWNPATVPTSADNAYIDNVGTYTVTINTIASVKSIHAGAASGAQTLAIPTSQSLTFTSASTVSPNGTLTFSGLSLGGSGHLAVDGMMTWSSGDVVGAGGITINSGGILNVDTPAGKTVNTSTITIANGAIANWTGGNINLVAGGGFDNFGTFEVMTDAAITDGGTPGTFDNAGTFRKSGGAGSTAITNVDFTNSGTIEIQTGTFNPGNVTSAGAIDLTGNFLVNDGIVTFNAGTDVIGTGLLQINGGTVTANTADTIPNVQLDSGTLNGTAIVSIVTLAWNGGTMAGAGTTTIPAGGTATIATATGKDLQRTLSVINGGTVNVTGSGAISLSSGGNIDNDGLIDITTAVNLSDSGGAGDIVNTRTFRVNHAGTTTLTSITLDNSSASGLIDVPAGTLDVADGTSSAQIAIGSGASFLVNSDTYTLAVGTTVTGLGTLTLQGGTLNVTGNVSVPQFWQTGGGTVDGSGTLTFTNTATWDTGTMQGGGTTPVSPTGTLTLSTPSAKNLNNRDLTVDAGGNLNVAGNGPVNLSNGAAIANAGTMVITVDNTFSDSGLADVITNTGTLRKQTATGPTNITGIPLTNNGGLIDIQSGTISVADTFTQNAGSTLKVWLGGTTPGTGFGQLSSTNSVNLAGTLEVALVGLYQPVGGDTFRVISAPGNAGDFTQPYTYPVLANSRTFSDAYDASGLLLTVNGNGDLSISKTAPSNVLAGDPISYTLTVTNSGPDTANNVSVTDVLEPGHTFSSASGTGWTCGEVSLTVTCTATTLAVGTAPAITIAANAPATPQTFTNIANVSSSNDSNNANDSGSAIVTVDPLQADLELSAFGPGSPLAQSTAFTFTFDVHNYGPQTASNVVFTANVPATLTYDVAVPDSGGCGFAGGTITCNLGNIGSGATISIAVDLFTTTTAGTHTVDALVNADEVDPDSLNDATEASVEVTGSTITVTNTNDGGMGSLREALEDAANGVCTPLPCTIDFNIPGGGPHVIQPTVELPLLQSQTIIDATTQPGYTNAPLVQIDGQSTLTYAFEVNGNDNAIKGFSMTGFDWAIDVHGDNNTIEASYLGLDTLGATAANGDGIRISGNANTVGGTTPAQRNVISGNTSAGVIVEGDVTGNTVSGNYIGTDPLGTTARPNTVGVSVVSDADSTTIGGATTAHANVISGNTDFGIYVEGGGIFVIAGTAPANAEAATANAVTGLPTGPPASSPADVRASRPHSHRRDAGASAGGTAAVRGNAAGDGIVDDTVIRNNWIGPDAAGTSALGAGVTGVAIADNAKNTSITENTISGNQNAITFSGAFVTGTNVSNNLIGYAPDGVTPMGNPQAGIIVVDGFDNTIASNTIAYNGSNGVTLLGGQATNILQNSIHDHPSLGIDIGGDGVTPNDGNDADSGPNGRQNFPTLTTATLIGGGNVSISSSIDSSGSPATIGSIRIDYFEADPTGEGMSVIGFACVAGNAFGVTTTLNAPTVAPGDPIVATATSYSGGACSGAADGTSEFSNVVAAASCTAPLVTITGPAQMCAGGSVTLDAGAGFDSYLWSNGATTQTITVSPATTTNYSVTVADNGCPNSDAHTVTVNPLPVVAITGPTSTCASAPVTLDAGAGFAGYAWSTGATTQTITVSPTTTTSYSVTVTDGNTCTAGDSHTVTVTANPTATITAPAGVCENSADNSASVVAQAGATYNWTIANGTITAGQGTNAITFTAAPSGTVPLGVTVTANGCTSTGSANVPISATPAVTITGPASACSGSTLTLDAGPGFTSYLWSNGATSQSIIIAAAVTQTYSVTVTSGAGCSATDSHTVSVTPAPSALITAPSGAEPEEAGLVASVAVQPGATYAWSITNGTITSGNGTDSIVFSAGASGLTELDIVVTLGGCSTSGSHAVFIEGTQQPSEADLGVTKSAPASVQSGATITYTIGIRNFGPGAATGVVITDTLPPDTTFVAMNPGPWNCTRAGATITCTGSAALGTNSTITISVKAPSAAGVLTNTVQITSDTPDPNGANNSASASTSVQSQAPECATAPPSLLLPADLASVDSPATFSWTAVVGATEYELWIGDSLATVTASTTATRSLPSGAFPWFVVARFANGCDPLASAPRTLVILDAGNCGTNVAPQIKSPAPGIINSPTTFMWSPVAQAAGYRLWIEANGTAAQDVGTTSGATMLSVSLPQGPIVAYVDALFSGCPPTRSAPLAFNVTRPNACASRTTAAPLSPPNDAVLDSSSVELAWAEAAGADGYRVWYALDGAAPAVLGATTHDTSLKAAIGRGSVVWFVETLHDGCASTESQSFRFTIPTRGDCTEQKPETLAPANNAALTSSSIQFVWTAIPGAASYELWVAFENGTPVLLGTTQSTTLTRNVPAGKIAWFVRAVVDRCGTRDSAQSGFTVTPPDACRDRKRPVPIAPLDAATVSAPVRFDWSDVGTARYELFILRGNDAPQLVATTSETEVDGVHIAPGRLRWFVRADFGDCASLDSAERRLAIVPPASACNALAAPVISAPGEISSGVPLLLQWTPIHGATAYQVLVADNANFVGAAINTVTVPEMPFQGANNTQSPLLRHIRVRAIDGRCQPVNVSPYGPAHVLLILPKNGNAGSAPFGGGNIQLEIALGPQYAGQTFNAAPQQPWLTVSPTNGVVPAGGTTLLVTADTSILPIGASIGSISVSFSAAAMGGIATHDTAIGFPLGISLVTPVSPMPSNTPPPDALIIPAVAHADGINSHFQSDVRVSNTSAQLVTYQLTFTPSGNSGITQGQQTQFSIEPGRTIALDDILKSWFGTGGGSAIGTLEIRPLTQLATSTQGTAFTGLANLASFASSRTFNVTSNGTFGQYIPAIPFANFIGSQRILSLQQIAQSSRYRTNLGIVEGSGEPASLLVRMFGGNGQQLGQFPLSLNGGQHVQLNGFLRDHGVDNLTDGRVEIQVVSDGGKITAYASVLDNDTSDPLLVTPVEINSGGATKWVVPGVADLASGFANWQTDMRVFNAGTEDVEAGVLFYSQSGGAPKTTTITIPAGQVRQFDKALASLFDTTNDGGAVHITTASPARLIATARTYNQVGAGTYGQFISAVTPNEAAGVESRPLQLLQVEETDRFRSNIGLVEVTGNPVRLEISAIPPDAKFTAVTELFLGANEFRQLGSLLRSMGLADTHNARVTVRVLDGTGRVTAYASVIDMLTNDPTYVPAQ